MKGHVGAVLTSGLAVLALALALLQLAVLRQTPRPGAAQAAARAGASNRYSAPGGRSGIPWAPFDKTAPPADREGRSPPRQQEEQHHSPPPRNHGLPPRLGPQVSRKLTA